MRIIRLLAASAALAACATAPESPPPAVGVESPAASSEAAGRVAALIASAGAGDSATLAQVESALGAPDVARRDGAGAALTYRYDTCALLLLFAPDARSAMRLAETHRNPRRAGVATPSLEQCASEAAARRAR